MEFIDALILGIVQGLTEFLPISSSGHLVLMQKWLSFKEHNLSLNIAAHFGTLLSVFTIYFHKIKKICSDLIDFPKTRHFSMPIRTFFLIALASIPTGIIGLLSRDLFLFISSSTTYVGIALCLTGVILFLTGYRHKKGDTQGFFHNFEGFEELTWRKALLIGSIQGLAIVPGLSRSGLTISVGLLMGLNKNVATSFSFLLSIPAILGATLIELGQPILNLGENYPYIITTIVTAYLFGLLGLKGILFFVKSERLRLFSIYLWLVGLWVIWGNF